MKPKQKKKKRKKGNISLHLFLAREAQPNSLVPPLPVPPRSAQFPGGPTPPQQRADLPSPLTC